MDSHAIALIESKRLCVNGIEQLYPDDDRQPAIAPNRMLLMPGEFAGRSAPAPVAAVLVERAEA